MPTRGYVNNNDELQHKLNLLPPGKEVVAMRWMVRSSTTSPMANMETAL